MKTDIKLYYHSLEDLQKQGKDLNEVKKELLQKEDLLTSFGKYRLENTQKSLLEVKKCISFCIANNKDFCYTYNRKPVNYDIINLLNK